MIRVGSMSLGAPHHAKIFAKNMNGKMRQYSFSFIEYQDEHWRKLNARDYDVVWFYGFFGNSDTFLLLLKEQNPKLKAVVMWVGSDILEYAMFATHKPQCKSCIVKNVDVHVTDGLNFIKELDSLGIQASFIPSIPVKTLEFKPLPEQFSVAAYVPGYRADFYNYPMIREVAVAMPDVEFHIFGGGNVLLTPDSPNVYYHGWVEGEEKEKWWQKNSAVLYLPKHGSLGVTAIEFLQMGRWAIRNTECPPHIFQCSSAHAIVDVLTELKTKKEGNVEGSEYYRREFTPEKQAEKVKQVLDRL